MAMGMDKKDWLKIQKNWEYLKVELDANNLLDPLRSCPGEILTHEDYQRVKYEVIDADKVEKLLKILKCKPAQVCGYKWFLGCLKKYQDHVAEKLEKTPIGPDEIKDESTLNINSMVREILLRDFVDEDGKSVTLPEVRKAVAVLRGRHVNFDWNDGKLKDFVVEVFSGVIFEQGRGKKKVPKFLNLGAREQSHIVPSVCSLPENTVASPSEVDATPEEVASPEYCSEVPCLENIQSMSTEELCCFLEPIFAKLGLAENFRTKFKHMEIDGVVFLTLREEDFKEEFSSSELSFGKRRKLMLEINNLLKDIKQGKKVDICAVSEKPKIAVVAKGEGQHPVTDHDYKEYFRKFDTPVAPTDKYTRGRKMELSGFSRENMINPVKRFLKLDKGDDIYRKMAKETVMFASACMNDRKNGTLYVGINPIGSEETGQVVGVLLDKQKCEDSIRKFIGEAFFEDQQEIAFQTIRSSKFIEVLNSELPNTWVVEIDVVPLGEIVKDEAFFIRGKQLGGHKSKRKEELYRLVDGTLQSLSEREIYEYMKKRKELTELRLQQEIRSSDSYVPPDLRKQILNLFTGGSETVEDEIYPVLMTSPLDSCMDEEYIKENLSFIQYFDAKVVFDFDPDNYSKGLFHYFANREEQLYEVHTTDNFDKTSESYSDKNIESLKMSSDRSWVFCNGYRPLEKGEMEPFDWKQNRSDGFKEALRFFHSSIPLGRGMVLIFLFSKNYEVLLEAAHEVILTFKDQWMVIAESEEIASLWRDEMTRRHVVSAISMDNRCVLGMPWRHVNATFTQIISPKQTVVCELPTSTGAFCTLKERDKMDMNDLEILSRSECDGEEELQDSQSRETVRRRAEETFFRGGQVRWLNFWFSQDHVLKRKQHGDIMGKVRKSLETSGPDDDERVSIVTLLHQPGAGGSTSSRQILWDLKSTSRCCVVTRITDDTATQITKLRNYEEKVTKKPPLVLVDNEDEDKVCQLILQLEEKAKFASRSEEPFKVFCAVLHCIRRVNLPKSQEGDKIILKHELQTWELSWFQRKYETLERKFNEDRKVDPKLLISFNILKTNFDANYIKRTVAEFMKEIDDTKESMLLRYLSLINSFDIDFQTIPISAFDPIIGHQSKQKRILQFGILEKSGSRGKGWETTLSTSVRVLINESSQRGAHGTRIRTIRITSALLAKEILSYIVQTNSQQTSEIMVEFLTSAIFDCENSSTYKLLSIIKNLVKRRLKQKDGRPAKFSPLILDIMEKEGADKAAEICEEVYRKTEDPMIAQQIARFYIFTKNWTRAEKYARICTQNLPKNSFLWDTYGQVYKQQLLEHYNRAKAGVKISNEDASEILLLAQRAIDTFRKEQVLSETEKSMINNHGGYLGELRVTLLLMNTICHFESYTDGEDLHRFLVDQSYSTEAFSFLDRQEEEMLKSLGESAFKAIRKLEDELVHLKGDSREALMTDYSFDKRTLVMLKENVNTYFGEDSDDVPSSLSPEDACEYRRRRVRRMGLTSLQGALALKYEDNGEEKLQAVFDLIIENVNAECCTAFDLVTILNTVIALHVARSMVETIHYPKILEWSSKLYEMKQPEDRPYLETFLYLVLFHLPTESRRSQGYRLCSEVKIQEALARWKEAFYISYPKQRDVERLTKRKDTTLFFLGRGVGMKEVVYQKELLNPGERMRDNEYWQSEKAKKRFQRLEGTLLVGGLEVQVQLQLPGGNKFHITIPTSLPTMKRSMWQKRVFFVLGFSWSGPKAYDITLDDPSNGYDELSEAKSFPKPTFQRGQDVFTLKLADIEAQMTEVKKEIETLERKKPLSKQDKKKMASLERKQEELMVAKSELLGID